MIAALLVASCAEAPPPPVKAVPSYNEVVWTDYCAKLHAAGTYDTPNGDCRRLYDVKAARQARYEAQQRARSEQIESDHAIARGLSAAGNAMTSNPSMTCRSRETASGRIKTVCQ